VSLGCESRCPFVEDSLSLLSRISFGSLLMCDGMCDGRSLLMCDGTYVSFDSNWASFVDLLDEYTSLLMCDGTYVSFDLLIAIGLLLWIF